MFSATFPRSIETLAKTILKTPVEVVVGNRGQACASVEQKIEIFEEEDAKLWKLIQILGEWYSEGSILIFTEKKVEADDLFKELYKIGYKALVLHGGMDQEDRENVIRDFKDKVRTILIATSVCARGLDINHIRLVVNFVCPSHLEDYVHRVGRTGRAGTKGTAYTFIT
jgi:ATP-dependent RNA helicase DDX46/PRP5